MGLFFARSGIAWAFLYLLPQIACATNYYIEQKTSLALQKTVAPEEVIWLKTHPFVETLGLFKSHQGGGKLGAVLILADLNHHPDWPQIINPLRNDLANHHWQTLSIQMPTKESDLSPLEWENIYQVAKTRIKSAVSFLTNNGNNNIVIIARRHSANIAIKFLTENEDDRKNITGFVGISIFDTPWINTSQLLRKMPIPYFDVFAQNDSTEVLLAAPKRLVSAKFSGQQYDRPPQTSHSLKVQQLAKNKTGNLHYRQTIINGAQSHFSKHQYMLLKAIRGWLKNIEAGR